MFPAGDDPKGDPETWTREELRRWLAAVRGLPVTLYITFCLTIYSETYTLRITTQGSNFWNVLKPTFVSRGRPIHEE